MAEPLLPNPPGADRTAEPGSDVERDQERAAEPSVEGELPFGELPDPPFRTPEPAREDGSR